MAGRPRPAGRAVGGPPVGTVAAVAVAGTVRPGPATPAALPVAGRALGP